MILVTSKNKISEHLAYFTRQVHVSYAVEVCMH